MPNSARYNKLVSRVTFIEKNLLPSEKVSGNYTRKEQDFIRAYILLVHAEIEAYFEDAVKEVVVKARNKWSAERKKSACLLGIMSFVATELNWEKESETNRNSIEFRINKSVSHFIAKLNKNHGIKSDNIKSLLLPIGVENSELDQTWLNTMDSFGSTRGGIAHTTHSVQNQIDLKTEKDRINIYILPTIDTLDQTIRKIK
jgi:hypothetical protein